MPWIRAIAAALLLGLAGPAAAEDQTDLIVADALEPWTGDLSEMAETRQYLRVGVPHSPLFVAFDGDKRIGLAVERGRELETHLRETEATGLAVLLIPLPRDVLLDALVEGRIDLVDANLTVIEGRADRVAFSAPLREGVREIVVSGAETGPVKSFDALAEIGLALRPSSSYFAHVAELNAEREAAGAAPIPVTPVDDVLEDADLIEMVAAGHIPAIVVDDHKARLFAAAFDGVVLNADLAVNEGGATAFALRPDAPELAAAIDRFVATIRRGTLLGNMLDQRYLETADWVERLDGSALERVRALRPIVVSHAETYGFDWRMILAQGYQESRLDQAKRSKAGAVGVMQVLPSTAKDPNVGIPDISTEDRNVEAGVKYLRFLKERHFAEPEIDDLDRVLLALAAYNAGPANIRKSRARAEKMGLDPNRWFDHVEIATAKTVSREPVVYVRNIYKYSVYLRLLAEARTAAEAAAGD